MYTRVRDLLKMGKDNNACILAFDCADVNMIRSVCMGAEKARKPVIMMLHPSPTYKNILPFGVFAQTAKYFAERVSVPVGLHLDHCSDFDYILRAMFDYFCAHPGEMPEEYIMITYRDGLERGVADYLSGMTDRYATRTFQTLFVPSAFPSL